MAESSRHRLSVLARCVDLLEGPPRLRGLPLGGHRPVDQVKVNVFNAEPGHTSLEGVDGRTVALVVVPQFRGDEEIRTGKPAGRHSPADLYLVAVQRSGVNASKSGFDGRRHRRLGFVDRYAEHTKPEFGDPGPVVQTHRGNISQGNHHLTRPHAPAAYAALPDVTVVMVRRAGRDIRHLPIAHPTTPRSTPAATGYRPAAPRAPSGARRDPARYSPGARRGIPAVPCQMSGRLAGVSPGRSDCRWCGLAERANPCVGEHSRPVRRAYGQGSRRHERLPR
jgi:hypothetical protein